MESGGFEGCEWGTLPGGRPCGYWKHGRGRAAAVSVGAVPEGVGRGAGAWVGVRVTPALAVPAL